MKAKLFAYGAISLIISVFLLAGCKGDSEFDPNYKPEVKMSEADKQREQQIMAGQKAPGGVPGGGSPGAANRNVMGKKS